MKVNEISADGFLDIIEPTEATPQAETQPQTSQAPIGSAEGFLEMIGHYDGQAIDAVTNKDPEQALRINRAATELNIPSAEAALDLEEAEKKVERNKVGEIINNSPKFTGFLARNGNVAPMFKNELEIYANAEKALANFGIQQNDEGEYEQLATTVTDLDRARADVGKNINLGFKSGDATVELGNLYYKWSQGELTYDEIKDREAELQKIIQERKDSDSWIAATGDTLGMMFSLAGNLSVEHMGAAGAVGAGFVKAAQLAPGVGQVLKLLTLAGSYGAMQRMEKGFMYADAIKQGATHEEAYNTSEATSMMNAGVELLNFSVIGKVFGPLLKHFTSKAGVQMAGALTAPTARKVIADSVKAAVVGTGSEVSTEVIQELINVTGEAWLNETAGTDFDLSYDAIEERMIETAYETFRGTVLLGGLGMTSSIAAGIHKINQADKSRQFFEVLHEQMKVSEVAQNAPEVAAEAVQEMAEDSGIDTVYVDAHELQQVMAEANVSAEQLELVLPGVSESLAQKIANREDVEIPVGEYAAKIAGTDFGVLLQQHTRLRPDDISSAEAVKVQREQQNMMRGILDGSVDDTTIEGNLSRFEGVSTEEIKAKETELKEIRAQAAKAKGDEKKQLQAKANSLLGEIREAKKVIATQYKAEYDKLKHQYAEQIKAVDVNGKKKDKDIALEAKYGAWLVVNLARRSGLTPDMISKLAPTVRGPVVYQEQQEDEVLEQKAEVKVYSKSEWRVLNRTLDNMTDEERAAFDEYVNSRPDADRVWSNLERLKDTPWAKQAIEAVFVRIAMRDLMNGREPRVQSMLDNPQLKAQRDLLKSGENGLWEILQGNGFVGNASKPAHNVNSSFLNCDPSNDCAKFCYATKGNYNYAASVVKSELVSVAVALDPVRAAQMTAIQYKSMPEFLLGKALRLFDKGDGDATWIPYIEALNKEEVRVQIFSKRPDFLRQVSDFNLRLLSVDESNKAVADENPDLPVAFVYSTEKQIPEIVELFKRGQLQVVLPVKEGRNLLDAAKVKELIKQDKNIAKHVCPIDAGWKNIKTKKNPEGWNCTMCDKNAGVGCFVGSTTRAIMDAAAKAEAKINTMGVTSLSDLISQIENVKKELDNAIESMGEQGNAAARGTSDERGSLRGSSGGARAADVSHQLDQLLQALFSRINARAERNGSQRISAALGGALQDGTQGAAGLADIREGMAAEGFNGGSDLATEQTQSNESGGPESASGGSFVLKQVIGVNGAEAIDQAENAYYMFELFVKAREMEEAGFDAKAIRDTTGWERGHDGKWRYEIDDLIFKQGIKFDDVVVKNQAAKSVKLKDAIEAEDLFKAYSFLEDYELVVLDLPPRVDGWVSHGEKRIYVTSAYWDNGVPKGRARSVLVHEVQHAIQRAEGFDVGGDPEMVPTPEGWTGTDEELKKYKKDIYRRLRGEVEARNVAKRMLDPKLRVKLLSATEDVSAEYQLTFAEAYNTGTAVAKSLDQIAWHGSPYRFSKFLLEKIGTGEGAQAHGWGLYFALNEETARGYRERLKFDSFDNIEEQLNDLYNNMDLPLPFNAQLWNTGSGWDDLFWTVRKMLNGTYADYLEEWEEFGNVVIYKGWRDDLDEFENDTIEVNDFLNNYIEPRRKFLTEFMKVIDMIEEFTDPQDILNYANSEGLTDEFKAWFDDELRSGLEEIASIQSTDVTDTLYKVDIPEDDVMLDEQASFEEQPEFIQGKIRDVLATRFSNDRIKGMNGRNIYLSLADVFGSPKNASLWLNENGIKGIRYDGRQDGPCAVVFDEDAVNILEMAQAELDEFTSHIDEANMVTTGSYSITHNSITLTPNANLTTFAHEMGHWYLETLFAIYDQTTSASVRADVETMLKDFGLNSIEAWYKLPMKDREVLHERFAFYVEQYLSEGKAPTKESEGFFNRFGKWLLDVYKRFAGGPSEELNALYRERFGIELPPMSEEVRRVLDRMVASENAVKTAEQAEGIQFLFEQKPEGMSDEEWQRYLQDRDEAEAEAMSQVHKRMARDEKWYSNARSKKLKEIQAQAEEVRSVVRDKVEKEVAEMPAYKAFEMVTKNGLKISEKSLKDAGFDSVTISKLKEAGCVKKGGMTVDEVRQLALPIKGYRNNRQFVMDLLKMADRDALIEDITTKRCLKNYSEMFDTKKVNSAIADALHNEARGRAIATELSYLANDKQGRSRIYREAARRAAKQMVGGMPIGSVTVRKFLNAESRAASAAMDAMARGDRYAAVMAKRAQLVNHEAALIAIDLEKKKSSLRNIRTTVFKGNRKLAKTRDIDIINVIRYVLTNMGLGKGVALADDANKAQDYIRKLAEYDPEKFAIFDAIFKRYPYRGPVDFNSLPVSAVLDMLNDVQVLYTQSREAKIVMLDGKRVEREEVVNELLQQFDTGEREKWDGGVRRTAGGDKSLAYKWMGIKSVLVRVESWCRAMDGGKNGPFFNYIFLPIANAASKFRNENTRVHEEMLKILKPMIEKWSKVRDIYFDEFDYTFTSKADLIGAILHTGNLSNKYKMLLGGRGDGAPWATKVVLPDGTEIVDTSAWDNFIARMMQDGVITKEDMDAVQAIWDLTESMKPAAQAAYKKMYGTYFEEVEASEVVTPFGTYRGGYVPAVTDRLLVPEEETKAETERITQQDFVSQMPVHEPGFSKTRVPNYTKPLAFDLGLLCGHMQNVLKFSYIGPVAQEVAKILYDREFKSALDAVDPTWVKDMLAPWLKRSYEQTIGDGKTSLLNRTANKLRSIAGMNIMAGHVVNALQQTTGLTIAATKVDPKYMGKALVNLFSREASLQEMTEMSEFMKARIKDRAIEYQSKIERIARTPEYISQAKGLGKLKAADAKLDPLRDMAERHAYCFQVAMQAPVDCIVWFGAYMQALDQGMAQNQAIAEADSVVRTTLSDFAPENLAAVETGNALKRCFLVFYNYFGMQLNLLGERWEGAKQTKKYGKFALDAALIVWIPSVLAEIIMQMIYGFDAGDDEEFDLYDGLRLVVGPFFKNIFAMIPFFGGAINSFGSREAKKGNAWAEFVWGDDPFVGRAVNSPAIDMIDSAIAGINNMIDMASEDEEVNARTATRNMLDLLSIATRLPVGALKKPAGYVAGVAAGDIEPETPLEAVQGFLSGKGVSK